MSPDTIIGKFSLFDLLTKFVSGFLLMIWLLACLENKTFDRLCYSQKIIFLVESYLFGLVMFKLSEKLLSFFSKNISCCNLYYEDRPFEECPLSNRSCSKKRILLMLCCPMMCGNCPKLIAEAKKEYKKPEQCIKSKYYYAYYYLVNKGQLGNIPILEEQVGFLKSMFVVVVAYGVCFPFQLQSFLVDKCWLRSLIALALLAIMIYVANSIQRKIYEMVWERYYYLTLLNKDEAVAPQCKNI